MKEKKKRANAQRRRGWSETGPIIFQRRGNGSGKKTSAHQSGGAKKQVGGVEEKTDEVTKNVLTNQVS